MIFFHTTSPAFLLRSDHAKGCARSPYARVWILAALLSWLAAGCSWVSALSQRQTLESRSLAQRARAAEQSGNRRQAENMLLEAIQKNPEDCELRLQLAKSYLANGDLQAGLSALRSAAEVQPENQRVYRLWAQTLIDNGRYDAALVPLQLGLNQDPAHVELWMLKGFCEEQTERYQQAFDSYQRVVQNDPEHSTARIRMAHIQIHWGRPSLAAPLLRAALQDSQLSDERRAEAWWMLGIVYGQEQRWHDAVYALHKGMKHKQTPTPDEIYRLAFAEFQTGDFAAASELTSELLASNPAHQPAQLLSQVLQMNGSTADDDAIIQTSFSDDLIAPRGW